MKDLRGKTAFITGGASGLGFAMAEALGRDGMNIMIADIEAEAAQRKVEELRARQIRAEWVQVDVTSRDSVRKGAIETIARFGKVHLIDGRIPHALILEIFTDIGIGPEITL